MDRNMLHGQEHAAWTLTSCMDMAMQNGHGHADLLWTCNIGMDMVMQPIDIHRQCRHGYGHIKVLELIVITRFRELLKFVLL
jgi:hypothetical protein